MLMDVIFSSNDYPREDFTIATTPHWLSDRLFRCWEDKAFFVLFWPWEMETMRVITLKGNDANLTSIVQVIGHVKEQLLLRLLLAGYLIVIAGNKQHMWTCCQFCTKNVLLSSEFLWFNFTIITILIFWVCKNICSSNHRVVLVWWGTKTSLQHLTSLWKLSIEADPSRSWLQNNMNLSKFPV